MKAWLSGLPTTALVIFTGCVLAFLTCLFFFLVVLIGRTVDDGNWNAWLLFVAALLGVGYQQFSKKRTTENPEIIRAHTEATKAETKKIEATAAAIPPLTAKEAENAGIRAEIDS